MMSPTLILYHREITYFLMSMSIKWSPMVDMMNARVLAMGGTVLSSQPETWKYYLNLKGQYHPTDTRMEVASLDTQEIIPYTPESLARHPKTAAAYVPGTPQWAEILTRYKGQEDLVKAIRWPATQDIYDLIKAPDFTIVSYAHQFLEDAERDVIVDAIKTFLQFFTSRWYPTWLSYEDAFYVTWWAQLWQLLYGVIITARIENIRTPYVHSYHIWEYLKANGLEDYSDLLTPRQTRFLYRNWPYIEANIGKKSTLTYLANGILPELAVGLVGKIAYQTTEDIQTNFLWTPEIISERVPTDYADLLPTSQIETIESITQRLYATGDAPSQSFDHIRNETKVIASTQFNILPTKLLELKPVQIERRYADALNNFMWDTLTYAISNNYYQRIVKYVDVLTGVGLDLSLKDIYLLLYYVAGRLRGVTLNTIPQRYHPYAIINPSPDTIPATMPVFGRTVYPEAYVPTGLFDTSTAWPAIPVRETVEFDQLLATQFRLYVSHEQVRQSSFDLTAREIHRRLMARTYVSHAVPLDLSPLQTFDAWISEKGLTTLIAGYEASEALRTENYTGLWDTLFALLVSLDGPAFAEYAEVIQSKEFYARLKQLFIQLCSYDILFQETSRQKTQWWLLSSIGAEMSEVHTETSVQFELPLDYALGVHSERTLSLDLDDYRMDLSTDAVRPYFNVSHGPHVADVDVVSDITLPQIDNQPIALSSPSMTTFVPIDVLPSTALTVEVL